MTYINILVDPEVYGLHPVSDKCCVNVKEADFAKIFKEPVKDTAKDRQVMIDGFREILIEAWKYLDTHPGDISNYQQREAFLVNCALVVIYEFVQNGTHIEVLADDGIESTILDIEALISPTLYRKIKSISKNVV